jgi:hypothetical protein
VTDPTAGEVSRALAEFRSDVRDDLRSLRDGQQVMISRDVYLADRRADQIRSEGLERENRQLRDNIEAARLARVTNRRWVIAAVIIPLGIGILDLYFALKGVK